MTLVRVGLSIDGDQQYLRAFDAFEHELRDMHPALERVGEILLASVEAQYATEGAHSGAPWPRLSAAYAAWKAVHFPAERILVQTGRSKGIAVSPGSLRITSDKLVYEPDSKLLAWHFRGAGHLPARRIVDLNSSDRRGFDRSFHEWLNAIRRGPIGAH